MIDMDLKRPSYQNYMGFVDEDQEDFEWFYLDQFGQYLC
jgi:hypothetical protein